MRTKWVVGVIAALVVVCVGAGVGIGWMVWGERAGTVAELERINDNLEQEAALRRESLSRAESTIEELAEREQATGAALERAERRNQQLEDGIERAAESISGAIQRESDIAGIIREVREAIERAAAVLRDTDSGPGGKAPP